MKELRLRLQTQNPYSSSLSLSLSLSLSPQFLYYTMPPSHNGYGNPNERDDTFTKFAAGCVSIALLIGVIISIVLGIVQTISQSNTGDLLIPEANDKADTNPRYASVKAVTTICAPTDYKEACLKSLAPVAHDDSSLSTKELLKAAFTVTVSSFYKALNLSRQMAAKTVHPMERAALSDCEDLLQYAVAEVQASFSEVGDKDMKTLPDRVKDIKNWLSAVISYQETCIDGITNPEIKSAMKEGMIDASQLTSNALAIVSEISAILSTLEISFNLTALSRSLLEHPIDSRDYPTWLSTPSVDRELLESNDKDANLKPNVVVAKDGSGEFKTINDALKAMPKNNYSGRYMIYVKAGIYLEKVIITNEMENVFMYGDGPKNTIITGDENFVDGTLTYQTATFAAVGKGFIAKSMGIRNTAGPAKNQAVALRVQSDMSAFINCRIDGYQGTLYAQTHRQFYKNCVISGTIDFIFGDSAAVFQNCLMVVRKPMDQQQNTVTAHGRKDKRESTGFVIQHCRVVAEKKLFPTRLITKTYLGRPWKEYSRTVVMESSLDDLIHPDGWVPLDGDFALKTLFFAEFNNFGPGAGTDKRVTWPGYKVITERKEALEYTIGPFIQGDQWLRGTGVHHILGLKSH
ncbi:pectinesterase-like protein [Cinnamomum micranthum f. kanehirae]|uniref:Pectinesterase n=1 Tax=Cinnamomum micranthum f. kanehirae TaxID=337451 RepID=A0A443PUR2_9MAGN|nr:pectinesterase-like protein [Cinnamomum micranthum f. kanehirae]